MGKAKRVLCFVCALFLVCCNAFTAKASHPLTFMDAGNSITPGFSGYGQKVRESGKTIQFVSKSHVIGFTKDRMYIAGNGEVLTEIFQGTDGAVPRREGREVVEYRNLWPGVDLRFETRDSEIMESLYRIKPGAKTSAIRFRYDRIATVAENGSLQLSSCGEKGMFTLSPPIAWQEHEKEKRPVDVRFAMHEDGSLGFEVGEYDYTRPLLIDPVYEWHLFLGSSDTDIGEDVAVDTDGNIYVTGYSKAAWVFPPGGGIGLSPLHDHSGGSDVMVVKFNSAGKYLWHTFYGSSDDDSGSEIQVGADGGIYIVGNSEASWNGPLGGVLNSPINSFRGGSRDGFMLKLDSNGNYKWHTFFGGLDYDRGSGLALSDDSFFITGSSGADWGGLAAPLNSYTGELDIFVLKLDANGHYVWHTFYGAGNSPGCYPAQDDGFDILADRNGDPIVLGQSICTWNGSAGQNPLHALSSYYDMVVLKLDKNGAYQWHTFYGSDSIDPASGGLALGKEDDIYFTGRSNKSWNGPGATPPLHAYTGSYDIVAVKLTSEGTYRWHTFYGSADFEQSLDIAIDEKDTLYLTGQSASGWFGPGGILPELTHDGIVSNDIYLLVLNGNGGYISHGFFGSTFDLGISVTTGRHGEIFITGKSDNIWLGPEGEQPLYSYVNTGGSGVGDFFVLRLTHLSDDLFPWPLFLPAILGGNIHD